MYAADEDSPFHRACFERIEHWRAQSAAWYTTWGILYEFLRATTHPRVMRRPWKARQAWGFVAGLLAAPGLGILVPTDRHATVAAEVIDEVPHLAGNVIHDAHTAILMWFLDRIATHILAFEGDSKLDLFEGNFSEYEEWRRSQLGEEATRPHRISYRKLTR